MSTNSIPITINGIRFRSLVEARWAEMFSKLGWEWEYEPIELNGYIPDFIIKFPYRHLLVEVKGETNMENIEQYADKIIKSGWDGEFLLVCSVLNDDDDGIYLGLLGATQCNHMGMIGFDKSSEPCYPTIKPQDYAYLTSCNDCEKYTIYNDNYGWFCRNCGSGNSNKSLVRNRINQNSKKRISICYSCKNYYDELNKCQLWSKNNNIYRCNCRVRKFVYKCRECNLYPYIDNVIDCNCEYQNEHRKIKQFWNEAKNSSQWKPK